jgi:hypothetical protein
MSLREAQKSRLTPGQRSAQSGDRAALQRSNLDRAQQIKDIRQNRQPPKTTLLQPNGPNRP